MTKPYAEQVSALADDELTQSEFQLLIRQAGRDGDVAAQLGRYAVIREALHHNLPDQVPPTLAERVSTALVDEPEHTGGAITRRRWMRPIAGSALAASVALVAIAVWPQQSTTPEGDSMPTAESGVSTDFAAGQPVSTENIQWDRLDPDVQARLQEYAVTGRQSAEPQLDILSRPVGVSSRRTDN